MKFNSIGLSGYLNKRFALQQYGTDVKTELIAGLTTFATMAYTLAVIPKIMHDAGLPTGAVLTAMVIMIFLATVAMGLYTNRPFALAPGLGSVAIFSVTLVQGQNIPWEVASGIVFISGVVFILVTALGIRDLIVKIIPKGIKVSISAGVGLFICLLGFRNAKIIVANASKNTLDFGNLTNPIVILATIGFVILLILEARKVRGGVLLAIGLTTLIGIPMGITKLPTSIFSFPSPISDIAFKLNILDALDIKYLPYLFAFFIPDFFSSLGTALGVGGKAGFLDEKGDLPGIDKVFQVDSIATTIASLFSIPVLLTYLESASGVEAGGRTGLTAITTAMLFLLTLFITPIALMIPSSATAPVLILVGMSMLKGMHNIDYTDITEYLPAFLSIALTIFTFNVGNGISAAIIVFVILKVASGRGKELQIGHYLLFLILLYYFYALAHAG